MSRVRRPSFRRRERRDSHGAAAEDCVIARPPGAYDDVWIGFCENLGLWRIFAPPFDAHGVMDPGGELDGFYTALADAAEATREARPELTIWFVRLLNAREV